VSGLRARLRVPPFTFSSRDPGTARYLVGFRGPLLGAHRVANSEYVEIVSAGAEIDPTDRSRARAVAASCWTGPVDPEPVLGGLTNAHANFRVVDDGVCYFVRVNDDIPAHGVLRLNELTASRAAHAAGLSPAVVHSEPGVLVWEYRPGTTLTPEKLRERATLERVLALLKRCHQDVAIHLAGPVLGFWVFQVVRTYAHRLESEGSRWRARLPDLLATARTLEERVGAVRLVFSHNDLVAANLIDDGRRLWLVDWEYSGFNSPLFDLAGLASHNALSEDQEEWLLEQYFEAPLTDELRDRFRAMKGASYLREAMWGMVSEAHLTMEFDCEAYTEENLGKLAALLGR
jgi:thiamine kinase-like enzyme